MYCPCRGMISENCGERTTSGVVRGERLYKRWWKQAKGESTGGRTDRRKKGVNTEKRGCEPKNSLKILLTENGRGTILPMRQSLPSLRTFRRSSPIRTPEKTVNEEYRCRHN